MEQKPIKISFPRIFKIVGVICGIALLVFLTWMAVIWQKQNAQANQLAKLESDLVIVRQMLYDRQNAGIYGGTTPAGTIYLYYEFLESRVFPVLSTYFIPENRQAELTRFDGVSEKEILAFVEELRSAEAAAKKASPTKSPYIMTTPLKMELQKMENGVWEFTYIDRKLK